MADWANWYGMLLAAWRFCKEILKVTITLIYISLFYISLYDYGFYIIGTKFTLIYKYNTIPCIAPGQHRNPCPVLEQLQEVVSVGSTHIEKANKLS